MEIEKENLVPLREIHEMDTKQRVWLEVCLNVTKGYFEQNTEQFVVAKKH